MDIDIASGGIEIIPERCDHRTTGQGRPVEGGVVGVGAGATEGQITVGGNEYRREGIGIEIEIKADAAAADAVVTQVERIAGPGNVRERARGGIVVNGVVGGR